MSVSLEEKKRKIAMLKQKISKHNQAEVSHKIPEPKVSETINNNNLTNNNEKIIESEIVILDVSNFGNIFKISNTADNKQNKKKYESKGVQTTEQIKTSNRNSLFNNYVKVHNNDDNTGYSSNVFLSKLKNLYKEKIKEKEDENMTAFKSKNKTVISKKHEALSAADYETLSNNQSFEDFIFKSSKYVEKLFKNDIISGNEMTIPKAPSVLSIKLPKSVKNCFVNDMSWSPFISNIVCLSYNNKLDFNLSKNYISSAVYDISKPGSPEYVIKADSEISKIEFSKSSPQSVICGSKNGQLGVWDLRMYSREPVIKSNITRHCSQIISIDTVGSLNANSLVTVSENGTVSFWDLSNLSNPVKSKIYNFKYNELKEPIPIFPKCGKIHNNNNNLLYIGCCDNTIKVVNSYKDDNNLPDNTLHSHNGIVSSLTVNNSESGVLKNLLISSGFDWEIHLWNQNEINHPIHSFDIHKEYVTSVNYNPKNPGIFSSTDAAGNYFIWDLFKDLKNPIKSYKLDDNAVIYTSKFNCDGDLLGLSDLKGNLTIKKIKDKHLEYSDNNIKLLEELISYKTKQKVEEVKKNSSDDI